ALDVLVSCLMGCLALVSLWFGRTDLVLLLTVLALVGFVGSVTLARFAAAEPEAEGRILTAQEAAEAEARARFGAGGPGPPPRPPPPCAGPRGRRGPSPPLPGGPGPRTAPPGATG